MRKTSRLFKETFPIDDCRSRDHDYFVLAPMWKAAYAAVQHEIEVARGIYAAVMGNLLCNSGDRRWRMVLSWQSIRSGGLETFRYVARSIQTNHAASRPGVVAQHSAEFAVATEGEAVAQAATGRGRVRVSAIHVTTPDGARDNFMKAGPEELSQPMNVLRGEMSLVKPRPIIPAELPRYGADAAHNLAIVPGVTGWSPLSGRSDTCFEQRVRHGRHFVRNRPSWSGISILFGTVPAVLLKRGAI